ncbi:MAG: hypothetical protein GY699_10325 [Desulfobacteraceae bacterium]|nr:hypothetical protein [Desulfobacteraceae bacterium]
MFEVAEDIVSEHPDEKMMPKIQKAKMMADDMERLKLGFNNKSNPLFY